MLYRCGCSLHSRGPVVFSLLPLFFLSRLKCNPSHPGCCQSPVAQKHSTTARSNGLFHHHLKLYSTTCRKCIFRITKRDGSTKCTIYMDGIHHRSIITTRVTYLSIYLDMSKYQMNTNMVDGGIKERLTLL